jgi:carboxyl-terminal processing protease
LIGGVYKQVISEYVDDVSPDEILLGGIRGMLETLDPYAEFIEERENSEVDALSRGMYGGLGIKVRTRNNQHVVSYIYENVQTLTNLRIGDQILWIDSVSLSASGITDLRPFLRGKPGSRVHLVVRRPGVSDSLDLVVQRRAVTLDPLAHVDLMDGGILYLKINRFTRSSADSVRNVLNRTFASHEVRGVILDVRDNPGGLLESAVALVDQFIEPGNMIVSMRGRQPSSTREYPSREPAIDTDVPLAILVNGRSASASEIVAGAMQDLDRAVIIGQRTFGKGLVQTLVPLSHGATLKLTTSRYYIPSGRCIQRLVYRNGQASDKDADLSLPTFRTLRLDRAVRESNGIIPDVVLAEDSLPPMLRSIHSEFALFHFVALYNNRHKPKAVPLIDGKMKAAFHAFADSLSQLGDDPLLLAARQLEEQARQYGVSKEGMQQLSNFRLQVRSLNSSFYENHWLRIARELELEFAEQLFGERERIRRDLISDPAVKAARALLADPEALESALLDGHPN